MRHRHLSENSCPASQLPLTRRALDFTASQHSRLEVRRQSSQPLSMGCMSTSTERPDKQRSTLSHHAVFCLHAGGAFSGDSLTASATSAPALDADGPIEKDFSVGTFVTGILYGLQPDALFVIVPALTLPTKLAAAGYCLMFVLGTVGAMGGYTAVIGAHGALPLLRTCHLVICLWHGQWRVSLRCKRSRCMPFDSVVRLAGACSKAIKDRNPWLTTNLNALASAIAVGIGATMLATEWGLKF